MHGETPKLKIDMFTVDIHNLNSHTNIGITINVVELNHDTTCHIT